MPYITVMQTPRTHQLSFEDVLLGRVPLGWDTPKHQITGTVTHLVNWVSPAYTRNLNVPGLISLLHTFNTSYAFLFEKDRHSLYHTFYIPKRTKGYRKIDEPLPELMGALRTLRTILENNFGALYHTAAFAYVKGRSTIDAIKRHQQNKSRWFLKTDFSNFFGSTTEEFLFDMVSRIFPFSEVVKAPGGRDELAKALSLCFLDGGLPQGTPISPTLTNLMMVPIDHRIMNDVVKKGFVYTRYADDIQLSHRQDFDPKEMCDYINSVLASFNAPFQLKDEKTRYGSSAGRNWNLGVMLNRDNQITIGRKKKLQLKAALTSFIRDYQSGDKWDIHDVYVLSGQISYYKMVEKKYVEEFIKWFNEKHGVNVMKMIRSVLRSEEQS